mgnify:CR=1 FL=1
MHIKILVLSILVCIIIYGMFLGYCITKVVSSQYRLTYYADSLQGQPLGCGQDIYGTYDPSDPTTAAVADGAFTCGQRLAVCADVCITVIVKDKCGECEQAHIDLSRAAWNAAGGKDYGDVQLSHANMPKVQEVVPPVQIESTLPRGLPKTGSDGCLED